MKTLVPLCCLLMSATAFGEALKGKIETKLYLDNSKFLENTPIIAFLSVKNHYSSGIICFLPIDGPHDSEYSFNTELKERVLDIREVKDNQSAGGHEILSGETKRFLVVLNRDLLFKGTGDFQIEVAYHFNAAASNDRKCGAEVTDRAIFKFSIVSATEMDLEKQFESFWKELDSKERALQLRSIEGLSYSTTPAVLPYLKRMLALPIEFGELSFAIDEALNGLKRLNCPESTKMLVDLAGKELFADRVLEILGDRGEKLAKPIVQRLLQTSTFYAVRYLGKVGDEIDIKDIEYYIKLNDTGVAEEGKKAIEAIRARSKK